MKKKSFSSAKIVALWCLQKIKAISIDVNEKTSISNAIEIEVFSKILDLSGEFI